MLAGNHWILLYRCAGVRTWAVGLALLLGNLFWNINSSVYIYFIYIVITWFLKSREKFIRTITEYRKKKNIKKFKNPMTVCLFLKYSSNS